MKVTRDKGDEIVTELVREKRAHSDERDHQPQLPVANQGKVSTGCS